MRAVKAWSLSAIAAAIAATPCFSDDAKESPVKFSAFVDTYYAYDFNNPGQGDRIRLYPSGSAYATQPARNNELNVNLAYIDAKLDAERVHGRLALQAGNSVQVNYASDSVVDQARYGGGGAISRYLQEAYAGYEVAPHLWIDAGIYFSHIGFEGWISRDQWTYTRSIAADNSPYYQAGIRVSYAFSDQVSAQLHLLSGWQNINAVYPQKALGTQLSYAPTAAWTLTYNTFFGYAADGTGNPGARTYQDLIIQRNVSDAFKIAGEFDVGLQSPTGSDTTNPWYAGTLFVRYQTSPVVAVIGRIEKFIDTHDAVIDAFPTGFNTSGASLGVDLALTPKLLWRNEVRGFFAAEEIFYKHDGISSNDGFFVSSLSITL